MKKIYFMFLILFFIFISSCLLLGEENTESSVLESAKKAGFNEPAKGCCPSCSKEIVVDLSSNTSQCPYCNITFLSNKAIKKLENESSMPGVPNYVQMGNHPDLGQYSYKMGYQHGFKVGYQKAANILEKQANEVLQNVVVDEHWYKRGFEDGSNAGYQEGLKKR